ncbi:MAG: NYN domain-containing protein [Lachnospiraceae bacterium]|nr:NYN domain-containing protein [Lachnospiraceae bacterium]
MEEKKFALLIDADNISSKYIKVIIEELSKYGTITYKRLYGDLTKSNNRSWKDALLSHSINPVQQYNYTTGKNSTDSAMIIDAMDILYSGSVDGFCLATSDSDFTRLAMRLRESGMTVIGMGEQKTPEPFRVSCERFFFIDLLSDEEDTDEEGKSKDDDKITADAVTPLPALESLISKIIMENGINSSAMDIGELGSRITKYDTAFDIRNYGYTKFSKFLENFKNIELKFTENTVTAILKDSEISLKAIENDIIKLLKECEKNSCNTGQLNQKLIALHPSFSFENYGYTRFSKFLSDLPSVKVTSLGRVVTLNSEYANKEAKKSNSAGRKTQKKQS